MYKVKHFLKKHAQAFFRNNAPANELLWGDSYWHASPNLWEPSVLIALKDLCRAGNTVYDVGGNLGGVSSAISRLVGPNGIVCTFEASPRIVPILQRNLVAQGHFNVMLYNRAVYSRSNELVDIYNGDHLNDSIYVHGPSGAKSQVKTLCLDDFCRESGLAPEVIKMDIEGAEYDALLGAASLIEEFSPHLILEQQASDARCFSLLKSKGYIFLNLSSYEVVKTTEDFGSGQPLSNLLAIHERRLGELPYKIPLSKDLVSIIKGEEFTHAHAGKLTSAGLDLPAGRYVVKAEFSATGTNNNMMCGLRAEGTEVFRYHAYSKLLADNYREWIIDLPRPGSVTAFFDFHDGTSDATLRIERLEFYRLAGVQPSKWASLVLD